VSEERAAVEVGSSAGFIHGALEGLPASGRAADVSKRQGRQARNSLIKTPPFPDRKSPT
jgi:hypothetical protein